jgi:hypothetical protein
MDIRIVKVIQLTILGDADKAKEVLARMSADEKIDLTEEPVTGQEEDGVLNGEEEIA